MVVGGGVAGLTAAVYLARSRRWVVVVGTGPRARRRPRCRHAPGQRTGADDAQCAGGHRTT
ncbi:MAG: NAD(P)-binding protein [Pseudonocardiaceae bacterium]